MYVDVWFNDWVASCAWVMMTSKTNESVLSPMEISNVLCVTIVVVVVVQFVFCLAGILIALRDLFEMMCWRLCVCLLAVYARVRFVCDDLAAQIIRIIRPTIHKSDRSVFRCVGCFNATLITNLLSFATQQRNARRTTVKIECTQHACANQAQMGDFVVGGSMWARFFFRRRHCWCGWKSVFLSVEF